MKSIIYLVKAKSLSALLISKSQHDFHYKCTKTNLYTTADCQTESLESLLLGTYMRWYVDIIRVS